MSAGGQGPDEEEKKVLENGVWGNWQMQEGSNSERLGCEATVTAVHGAKVFRIPTPASPSTNGLPAFEAQSSS